MYSSPERDHHAVLGLSRDDGTVHALGGGACRRYRKRLRLLGRVLAGIGGRKTSRGAPLSVARRARGRIRSGRSLAETPRVASGLLDAPASDRADLHLLPGGGGAGSDRPLHAVHVHRFLHLVLRTRMGRIDLRRALGVDPPSLAWVRRRGPDRALGSVP